MCWTLERAFERPGSISVSEVLEVGGHKYAADFCIHHKASGGRVAGSDGAVVQYITPEDQELNWFRDGPQTLKPLGDQGTATGWATPIYDPELREAVIARLQELQRLLAPIITQLK